VQKFQIGAFGLAGAIITGVVAEVTKTCPTIVTMWPAMLTAGVMAGWGLWLRSPKQ
jgi:hypothetical protein